jgi:hypothetical protein
MMVIAPGSGDVTDTEELPRQFPQTSWHICSNCIFVPVPAGNRLRKSWGDRNCKLHRDGGKLLKEAEAEGTIPSYMDDNKGNGHKLHSKRK